MARVRPLLNKPTKGWRRDLPLPDTMPDTPLEPKYEPPNFVDEVCMELSHGLPYSRMLIFMLIPFLLIPAIAMICILFIGFITGWDRFEPIRDFGMTIVIIGAALIILYPTIFYSYVGWRLALYPPRDQPLRFNRKRGKVYFYRSHDSELNYENQRKGARGVTVEVYNWADLRAETWDRTIVEMTSANGVDVAVVKPGTKYVLDRFPLLRDRDKGVHMWDMARAFMNGGPDALPKYPRPPHDWNTYIPELDPITRYAPKVQWPEEMDIESRTAP